MPIYTRTGDKGLTSLFDKTRVLKSTDRVETYGTIDELNSTIGLAVSNLKNNNFLKKELQKVQHDLLEIGSALANPTNPHVAHLDKRPTDFEKLIDKMTEKMPELKNFILPGGGRAGATLHVARTIARRTERRIVALIQEERVDDNILIYVNRLSDLLFTMARFANFKEKKKQIVWKKR